MNKAIFLDKDGTLIVDVPYNVDPNRITFYPDAVGALRTLQTAGYRLVVVSNQSGVARGYFAESALTAVWQRLADEVAPAGVVFDGFYYCPHHAPDAEPGCNCRKPQPGMLRQAANELAIDLSASWMVGDILNDVEAGNRAGCRTVLVDRGHETEWLAGPYRTPTVRVSSLQEAAGQILRYQPTSQPLL
ncbi:HAD-IIIA family hydrolase [Rudanella paleaurantiibacter]|uniref:D,D-heptose 1,7-bisphosphate phosphatase n=1 Tax=Rudanella paleaurantiibacter TaxID=2614655 RepID=A0A7J5U5V0_9BACT|nr:HAD family hydrolase [Rudanella paleaurantiibacter]KAB7733222.1 HAD-IIIA family hydrolase [Rudanella paleaurantiibacter]